MTRRSLALLLALATLLVAAPIASAQDEVDPYYFDDSGQPSYTATTATSSRHHAGSPWSAIVFCIGVGGVIAFGYWVTQSGKHRPATP